MTVNNGKPEMTNITPEYAAIGQRMRLIRKRKNLTQRGMGQILGMSGATVCQNENGVFSGMKYLEHFAEKMQISRNWLLTGEGESGVEKSLDQRTPAQRLIEMRQDMGLSQTALSRKIGVQSTSISLIEHERISMSAKFAQRVEDELGIGADWLLYGDESQKRWPCSGRMIDYLRRHPEERRKIWMEMRGNRDQDMFLPKTDDNPGNRIRTARIKGGMNQQMFAKKIQVQQSTVSRIENGDIHITDEMMQRICEALGADENWIRHGENL